MPRNAKIRITEVQANSFTGGMPGQARLSALMATSPTPTRINNGVSFAAVTVCTNPLPILTPRILTAASPTYIRMRIALLTTGWPRLGEICPSVSTKTLATAALARTAEPSQSDVATTNPMSGPNATSAHSYVPPDSDPRLPAAAKQRTISAIATAHTTYTIGAAAPTRTATTAG